MADTEKPVDTPESNNEAEKTEETKKVFKKVPKPDENAFKAKVEEINGEIKKLNDQVAELRKQIDEASNQRSGQQGVLNEARSLMNQLKAERQAARDALNAVLDARNAARAALDKAVAQNKAMKGEMKYTSLEEIEAAIARLQRQQNTTSMSLNEEKKLIKEMEALQSSKKLVAQFAEAQAGVSGQREAANSFNAAIAERQAAVKAAADRVQEQWQVLEGMSKDTDSVKSAVPALIEQRNALRKLIDEQYDRLRAARAEHKAANDEWYGWQREQRRLKAEKRRAEQEAKKAEYEARKAAAEAELAAQVPYEEEMALCDVVAKYLEGLLGPPQPKAGAAAAAAAGPAELEGMRALRRDSLDAGPMLGGGKKGKKGKKRNKDPEKKAAGLTHTVDSLASFGLLGVDPPATKAAVPAALEAVRAKKLWYSEQPRGAVEAAAAAAAAQEEQGGEAAVAEGADSEAAASPKGGKKGGGNGKGKKKEAFRMAEDLFPTLPGAKDVAAASPAALPSGSAAAVALAPRPERPAAPPADLGDEEEGAEAGEEEEGEDDAGEQAGTEEEEEEEAPADEEEEES